MATPHTNTSPNSAVWLPESGRSNSSEAVRNASAVIRKGCGYLGWKRPNSQLAAMPDTPNTNSSMVAAPPPMCAMCSTKGSM